MACSYCGGSRSSRLPPRVCARTIWFSLSAGERVARTGALTSRGETGEGSLLRPLYPLPSDGTQPPPHPARDGW